MILTPNLLIFLHHNFILTRISLIIALILYPKFVVTRVLYLAAEVDDNTYDKGYMFLKNLTKFYSNT